MRKILALILCAVVGVCGAVMPAAAKIYPDVTAQQEAISMISDIGIFEGYEDGTFRPDQTITRAEAAAVIVRMFGQEDAAKAMKGVTKFTDVPADHWASGYINYGVSKGYINGRSDTIYDPETAVSYEEIVKLVVAALGYTVKAENEGGYPSGYLSVASQEELTKGTFKTSSRADVAKIIYNALTTEMLTVTKYNSNNEKEYGKDGSTVLTDYLNLKEYKGVVTATQLQGSDITGEPTVTINNSVLKGDGAEFLGKTVVAYVNDEDEIVAITETEKNNTLVINSSKIESNTERSILYWKNGKEVDKKTTKVELSDNVEFYVNNTRQTIGAPDLTRVNGIVTLVDNDNDAVYDYVMVTDYLTEFVVTEIDDINYTLIGDEDSIEVDPENDDAVYMIYKNGVEATFEDVEVGDTVTVAAQDKDKGIINIYVSSTVITGEVKVIGDDKYTINGVKYEISPLSDVDLALGTEGQFYINVDGQIAGYDGIVNSNEEYGYFLAADVDTRFNDTIYTIKFVNEKGNEATLEMASKVRMGAGAASTTVKANDIAPNTFDRITLFKYTTNSEGKISKFITPINGYVKNQFSLDYNYAAKSYTYKATDNRVGKAYFDTNTIVFTVDGDDVSVTNIASILSDGEEIPALEIYDTDMDYISSAVVAYDAVNKVNKDSNVIVVTEVSNILDNGDEAIVFTGYQNGQKVSYTINPEEQEVVGPTDIHKGDVVMVGTNNGYVNAIVRKVDRYNLEDTPAYATEEPTNKSTYEDIFVQVVSKSNGRVVITPVINGDEDDLILNKSSINFIEVTENNVKTATYATINPVKYDTYIYVRRVDDVVVDVVIYD